jgi:hypothetical protein
MIRGHEIIVLDRDTLMHMMKAHITNIPDGAVIGRMEYNFQRDAICAAIYHDDFDEVPEGCVSKYFSASTEPL